jgi:hypothetical protein
MSTSDAADKAYDDVIGFKYRFINSSYVNVRVPNPVDNADIEEMLLQERQFILDKGHFQLNEQDPRAPVDDATQLSRTKSWLSRNAKWQTLSDNSGVAFTVGDKIWADEKGNPIKKKWSDLEGIRERIRKEGVSPISFWQMGFMQ